MLFVLFNHIKKLFSGKNILKIRLLYLFSGSLFLISCSNNHCDEPMYAPLIVSFYSEIDTSKQVPLKYLALESIGIPGFVNLSESSGVQLFLKKFDNSTGFSFFSANDQSRVDTLIFLEKRNSADCPCLNPGENQVSVYQGNNNIFFLCNRAGNMLTFHKEQPDVMFLKKENQDTLFVIKSAKDILTVKYTTTQVFVSAECGCLTTFYIDELKQHTYNNITDALITNRSVTGNYNEKHIRLYFENY